MHQVKDSLTLIAPSTHAYKSYDVLDQYSQQLSQRLFLVSMQVPPDMRPKEKKDALDRWHGLLGHKLDVDTWWQHKTVVEIHIS